MTRLWKILVSGAVVVGTIAGLRSFVTEPWHCTIAEQRIEAATIAAFDQRDRDAAIARAHENLRALDRCRPFGPAAARILMVRAANLRILQRTDEAIGAYEDALRYDRRPEIFLQLGLTQLERGRRDEARVPLVRAAEFDPRLIDQIPDVTLAQEVETEVARRLGAAAPVTSSPARPGTATASDGFPRRRAAATLPSAIGYVSGETRTARAAIDPANYLVFGPGETLQPGRYRVRFTIRLQSPPLHASRTAATIDVTSDMGSKVLARSAIDPADLAAGQWQTFTLTFASPRPLETVEYRLYWHATTDLTIADVTVERE